MFRVLSVLAMKQWPVTNVDCDLCFLPATNWSRLKQIDPGLDKLTRFEKYKLVDKQKNLKIILTCSTYIQ